VTCDIKSQLRDELEARFKDWGQPLIARPGARLASSPAGDGLGNDDKICPNPCAQLRKTFTLQSLELVCKRALRTPSKSPLAVERQGFIESVLIPANPPSRRPSDRHTPRVHSGWLPPRLQILRQRTDGWKRNLRAEESRTSAGGGAVERWAGKWIGSRNQYQYSVISDSPRTQRAAALTDD